MTCGALWWPYNPYLLASIVSIGTAAGPGLLGPLQSYYVNPLDVAPSDGTVYTDPLLLRRLPWLFVITSLAVALITLVSSFCLAEPAPLPSITDSPTGQIYLSRLENVKMFDYLKRETYETGPPLLRWPNFWVMWAWIVLNSQFVNYLSVFWKVIGIRDLGLSDHRLSLFGGLAMGVSNVLGRFFWPSVADWLGFRWTLCGLSWFAMVAVLALPMISFVFSPSPIRTLLSLLPACISSSFLPPLTASPTRTFSPPPLVGGFLLYTAWLFCMFACMGGSHGLMPLAVYDMFGKKRFKRGYALMYTARIAGTGFTALVMQLELGAPFELFYCSCCSAAAMTLSTFFRDTPIAYPCI